MIEHNKPRLLKSRRLVVILNYDNYTELQTVEP